MFRRHYPVAEYALDYACLRAKERGVSTVVARASIDREEVLIVPLDLARLDVTRTHWPFLRDRRIDAYGELTRRYIDD